MQPFIIRTNTNSIFSSCIHEPIEANLKVVPGEYTNDDCVKKTISYIASHTYNNYFFGAGCSSNYQEAILDFYEVKELYDRNDGKQVKHIVLSFRPSACLNSSTLPLISSSITNFFYRKHQVAYAVHSELRSGELAFHIHFIINTVNYTNGNLYRNSFTTINEFINYIESLPYNIQVNKVNNYY